MPCRDYKRRFPGTSVVDGGGDIPFSQNFNHNQFGDLDQRETEEWGNAYFYDAGTFVDHRRVGWGYDASGRIATIDSRTYTYDAAGRNITLSGQQLTATSTISSLTESGFDGEGNRVRENSGTSGSMTLKYYLTSSVLGNAVIEELNSSGEKQTGYVYTPGGTLLATQTMSTNLVKFIQASPHNTSEWGALTSGGNTHSEFDAVVAKVRLVNLTPPNRSGDPGTFPFGGNSGYSALENPGAGCTLDGIYMPCYMAMRGVGNASTVDYVDPFFAMTRGRFMRQQWVEDSPTVVSRYENISFYSAPGGHFEYVDDPDDVLEVYNQPQDPGQVSEAEHDILANDLKRHLSFRKDCSAFVQALLRTVAINTQTPAYDDVIEVFNHVKVVVDSAVGNRSHAAEAHGAISGNNATLRAASISFAEGQVMSAARGDIVLSESLHFAAKQGVFTDSELAWAGYQVAWAQGYNVAPPPASNDTEKNSNYFHNTLQFAACNPYQEKK